MKKVWAVMLVFALVVSLSGCSLLELMEDEKDIVDLGSGEEFVTWTLVQNDNPYRPVESAYFAFNKDTFRYYEDGELKKQGTHRITYNGVENTICPLHLNLNFGRDEDGFSVFDYIECYTEDTREDLHRFTIMSEGYHIDPPRAGGVPVRDYHLSEMPYAFGTYVKDSCDAGGEYQNGKANYLNCARLDGAFADDKGNLFYFANNSYSSDPESVSYTVYMRYENKANGTILEGTICMSEYNDFFTDEHHNVALIYVTHGDNEPAAESGVSVEADFELMDFDFGEGDSFSFAYGTHFAESTECEYDPAHFIGGTYRKITAD